MPSRAIVNPLFPFLSLAVAVVAAVAPVATAGPRQAVWASGPVGADGPWNAVSVSFRGQPTMALFPGHMWQTFLTTSDYCAFNNSVPHCSSGTYLKDSAVAGAATKIDFKPVAQDLTEGIEVRGKTNMYLDMIDLQFDSGAVLNHSVALIESETQMFVYPGGTLFPVFAGCLSLGAPDPQQAFPGDSNINSSAVVARMIPWALKSAGTTASSSFGLHYGSASSSAKVSGSLVFGGYDRNRVVGSVLTSDGDLSTSITLQAITLRVIDGSSPFPSLPSGGSTPNLLTQGNTSIPAAGLPVLLDPCSPYLTLPRSTCDAIAAQLPVTYNASLGLYLWNTTSPLYYHTVSSASTLSLTFIGSSNTQSLTIHVPLAHLNLTLSPPFTSSPVPYFPCFTGGTGAYVLGRAFLQDAFLGANWETKKVWLAQAPGPKIPTGADVAGIKADEAGALVAGKNEWAASWEGVWTVLTAGDTAAVSSGAGAASPTGTGIGAAGAGGAEGGNKSGLMVGIGVGAAAGGMLLVAAAWFLRRMRRAARPAPQARPGPASGEEFDEVKAPVWVPPVEAPGKSNEIYEVMGDHPGGHFSRGWR